MNSVKIKDLLNYKKNQLIEESLNKKPIDHESHVIYNKKTRTIISKHPSRHAAYVELIDKHRFHPDLTVLHPSEYGIYGVTE